MNAYVIMRETRFGMDSKVIFDHRADLFEDEDAINDLGRQIWSDDASIEPSEDNPFWYSVESLPCTAIKPIIKIHRDIDRGLWVWETAWSTYDYKDNYLDATYEAGNNTDFETVVKEAQESYQNMTKLDI